MKVARGRKSGSGLPNTKAVNDTMSVATTTEAAQYALKQFTSVLERAGVAGQAVYQKALSVFSDFAKYIGLANSGDDPWSGKTPPPRVEKVQRSLADMSADKLNIEKPIRFDFAIDPLTSRFVKAYSVDGADGAPIAVDKSTEQAMNKQLLAWLASDKNPKSKNEDEKLRVQNDHGVLYAFDSKEPDKIKKERDGKPVRADAEAMAKMFVDPQHGFAQFVQKANSSVQVTMHAHDYATHQPEKEHVSQVQAGG